VTHHDNDAPRRAHATILCFLGSLAGQARGYELLELRYRLPDGDGMGRLFAAPHELPGLAARALSLARRTDVYVGCAPRTHRRGGRDAVRHAHVLWADCDSPQAVRALERFQPHPAIVIACGIIRSGCSRCACGWAVRCWRHVASGADRSSPGGDRDER
jgi:hypothetical protein